ncbi:EAP30/Vps36 family-domain-containing protein [Clohesyomyces aquaticus]|uniref:Vacuolar-sorting protein SNF8 n=1 Tax=Clohesyomyces aquaticus TaxID=1231657 RepID=A0A1Y1YNE1_9PLEO|nr:EAP30/Vps36 family-domain-containing protein [Clohesyomyces aquaticus]
MDRTRRTPGLSSLTTSRISSSQYASHGASLRTQQSQSLATQLSVFQSLLHNFAITHSKDIRANPEFRAEFARMCSALGVDFLASSHHRGTQDSAAGKDGSSIWAQMLGSSVNDFYFNLGVLIVEHCRATRSENGGLISVAEIRQRIEQGQSNSIGSSMNASEDDIIRAVDSLSPLGSCFSIMKIGHRMLIRSVPKELNTDQSTVLEAIQVMGYVTVSMLQLNLNWERARAVAVVDDLMTDSLVWVDMQAGENEYWSPAFISGEGAVNG